MPWNDSDTGGIIGPAGGYDSWGPPGPGYPGGLWIVIGERPSVPPTAPPAVVVADPPPGALPQPGVPPLEDYFDNLPPYDDTPPLTGEGDPRQEQPPEARWERDGPPRLGAPPPLGMGWPPELPFRLIDSRPDMGLPRPRPWPDWEPFPRVPIPRRAPRPPRIPRRRRRTAPTEPPPRPSPSWPNVPPPPFRWPDEVFPERPLERIPQPERPELPDIPRPPGIDLPPPQPPGFELPPPNLPSPIGPGDEISREPLPQYPPPGAPQPPPSAPAPIPRPIPRGARMPQPGPAARAWPWALPWPFTRTSTPRPTITDLWPQPSPAPESPPQPLPFSPPVSPNDTAPPQPQPQPSTPPLTTIDAGALPWPLLEPARERDRCRCDNPEPNPSDVVARVKNFARRMSQNSLDNLRRGTRR